MTGEQGKARVLGNGARGWNDGWTERLRPDLVGIRGRKRRGRVPQGWEGKRGSLLAQKTAASCIL